MHKSTIFRIIAGILALSAAAGSAAAATVSYGMTFFDDAGTQVGTGVLSFDPSVMREIWLDSETTARCDPAAPRHTGDCLYAATWTPLAIVAEILDIQLRIDQFVEGSFIPPGRCGCGILAAFIWWGIDDTSGDGLAIDAAFGSFVATQATFWPDYEGVITGAVELSEIPLPSAVWLFLAGLFGLTAARLNPLAPGRPRPISG